MIDSFLNTITTSIAEHQKFAGYLWIIGGIILLLLEVGTPGLFVFISLACGTFAAALSAFLGTPWYVQCWIAITGSVTSFAALKSHFSAKKQPPQIRTNIDALIGQEATVIQAIDSHTVGRVKIRGEEWPAIAENQQYSFAKGTVVKVVRIQGNKLVINK
jgi:membrane protein implicated in regulation of membrane protease activity